MKGKLRITAIICIVALLLGVLAACGSEKKAPEPQETETPAAEPTAPADTGGEETPDEEPAVELPHYKIGLLAYTNAGLWWDRIYDAISALCEEYNCELVTAAADMPDTVIAAVENLCSSGVDGIIALSTGGVIQRLVEICEASQVFLVAGNNDVTLDAGYDSIAKNEYWLGDVYADEYETSYAVTKEMIENGAKNFVIFGLPPGISTSFDLRANGAMDAVKDAGLSPAVEARSFAMPEVANTFLTQYPNTDAVFSVVCSSTYITNPIMSQGYAGKLQVSSYEEEGDTVAAFEAGLLTHAMEGHNAQAQVCFALLYNALRGDRMAAADGTAAHILLPYLIIRSAEEYQLFLDNSTNGKYPFSSDDIKSMIKVFNPDASADSIQEFVSDFSIDWFKNR